MDKITYDVVIHLENNKYEWSIIRYKYWHGDDATDINVIHSGIDSSYTEANENIQKHLKELKLI